jgi:hypothetical protein
MIFGWRRTPEEKLMLECATAADSNQGYLWAWGVRRCAAQNWFCVMQHEAFLLGIISYSWAAARFPIVSVK